MKKFNDIVSVCLYPDGFNQKATNKETRKVVKFIASFVSKISIKKLAKAVTLPYAKCFTPALFKESINKKGELGLWKSMAGWIEQQLFVLDIDKKISSKEAIARCHRLHISPIFCYNSFSDTGSKETGYNRFRMVFMAPEPIVDIQVRHLINKSLSTLFPERDKKCDEESHLFYGGKKIIYKDFKARIDIHSVVHAVGVFLKEDYSNYSKNFNSYCNEVGLVSIKGSPGIKIEELKIDESLAEATDNFAPVYIEDLNSGINTYTYFRIKREKVKRFIVFLLPGDKSERKKRNTQIRLSLKENYEKRILPEIDFDIISKNCRLYREFITGERYMRHLYLIGIATNLLNIQGGETKFFEGLNSREEYNQIEFGNKKVEFSYHMNYFIQNEYQPQKCFKYCDYKEECEHSTNIITTSKVFRNRITVLYETPTITLEEAQVKLKKAIDDALAAEGDDIYVIKAPTAVGKTELIMNIPNVIIAVPTHKLKDEISVRMNEKNIKHYATAEIPDIKDEKFERELKSLYDIGAYSSAKLFLKRISGILPEVKGYIENLEKAQNTNLTTITTHERMFYFRNSNLKTLIIDENPLQAILKIGKVDERQILFFLNILKKAIFGNNAIANELYDIINELLYADNFTKMDSYFWNNIEQIELQLSEFLVDNDIKTNVWSFLHCSHFVKQIHKKTGYQVIHFIKKRDLPENKKIIILSATANEEIYRKLYGDRVKFIDIGNVENKGKLINYANYSFSRDSLKRYPDRLKLIQGLVKDEKVITYKGEEFKDKFPNIIANYGSLLGLDVYSGMDMSVVGIQHLNPIVYGLYALALGCEVKFADLTLHYIPIEHNGFKFYFNTFAENSFLRTIQLHLIEAELVQAIGRARLARNDCTVTFYNNFPIQGAEIKYLTKKEINEILNPVENLSSSSIEKEDKKEKAYTVKKNKRQNVKRKVVTGRTRKR